MHAQLEQALVLMRKARNDIMTGEDTLAAGRVFDTVCFHAQQAVEKSLKAVLAVYEVAFPFTHDLRLLLELVEPHAPDVTGIEDEVLAVAPYSVQIRYGGASEPDATDAAQAIACARTVYGFAEQLLALAWRLNAQTT